MPTLIVRGVSEDLHRWIKRTAKEHHRSMSSEALALLEGQWAHQVVKPLDLSKLPGPMVFKRPFKVTQKWLTKAIKEGWFDPKDPSYADAVKNRSLG